MENLIHINGLIEFRNVEYQYLGYQKIDDDSIFIILDEQFVKFYWNDTTINNKTFSSMIDFTYFLDSIL